VSITVAAVSASKTYRPIAGQVVQALQNVSFELSKEEILGVVGPSGCGKSTLLRLIAGVENPTEGSIERFTRNGEFRVGYIFQDSALMRWRTVYDNIRLPLELQANADGRNVGEMIRMVGLSGFERAYPGELSGGMQRRVAIARALIHKPNLLLMDEPFTGVDEISKEMLEAELVNLIRSLRVTSVLVTHDIDEAVYMADRILVFSSRPGRVVAEVKVPLPRNRQAEVRTLEAFHECCKAIREQLHLLGPLSSTQG
jgi:NitT/TauT family transport system ATP-binding protein